MATDPFADLGFVADAPGGQGDPFSSMGFQPEAEPGLIGKVKDAAGQLWRGATTPIPQMVTEATGRPYTSLGDMTASGVRAVGDLADRAITPVVDTVMGAGTTSALKRDFRQVLQVPEEIAKGVGGLIEFGTSPVGLALPMAKGVPVLATPEAQAAVGAMFGAEMAPGTFEAFQNFADNPARALVQGGMNLAPLAHVAESRRGLENVRQQRELGDQQAAAYQSAVPEVDRAFRATNEELAAERTSARVAGEADPFRALGFQPDPAVNAEVEARQRTGRWDPTLDQQQAPLPMNRAQRRMTAEVPETTAPDNPDFMPETMAEPAVLVDPRLKAIAQDLNLGEYDKLGDTEKAVVRQLRDEGGKPETRPNTETETPKAEPFADLGFVPEEPPQVAAPRATQERVTIASEDVPSADSAASRVEPAASGVGSGAGQPVRAADRPSDPGRAGAPVVVRIPGDESRSLEGRYVVRELDEVAASHNPFNFQPNPRYAYQNDRNYSDVKNAERIVRQSAQFDPAFLVNDSPDAVNGPPVVDSAGNVLGGNSRTMTLERVYASHPEAADSYRNLLMEKAQQFGVDGEQVRQMRQPILVREVTGAVDPQRAITDLNKTGTAALSGSERAIADARGLSPESLDFIAQRIERAGPDGTLAQALEGPSGPEVVNRLIDDGVISAQERPQYLDERGVLTPEGKQRISKLMLGRVFQTSSEFESAPPALRQKLEKVVPSLARLSGRQEWDLMPAVREALSVLEEARTRDVSNLDDLTAQSSMFGEQKYSPEAMTIAKAFQGNPNQLAKAFRSYAADEILSRPGQPATMFEAPTRADAFREAFGVSPASDAGSILNRLDAMGTEATERLRARGVTSGSRLSANEFVNPETVRDIAMSMVGDVARGVKTVQQFTQQLVELYGPSVRLHARKIWAETQRLLKDQSGEATLGRATTTATGPEAQAATGGAMQPPKKTATVPAVPGQEPLRASPSYDVTKSNILKNTAPETQAALAERMVDFESRNPGRKTVGFEAIREEARSLDPTLVDRLDPKQLKAGETLDPAVRFAARETLNALNQEIETRRKDLAERTGTNRISPEDRLAETRKLEGLEADARRLVDVLIPTRSQDGRNLAYHRMMAEKSFDVTYWLSRARRALAIPDGAQLPDDIRKDFEGTLARGEEAKQKAEAKVRAKRPAEPAPEPEKPAAQPSEPAPPAASAEPATQPREQPNRVEVVAQKRKEFIARLKRQASGDRVTVDPVSPAERALWEQDPEVLKLRAKIDANRAAAAKPAPTGADRIARAKERELARIGDEMSGKPKPTRAPSQWELTSDERAQVDADPAVRQARMELARKMMRLERTGPMDAILAYRRAGLLTGPKTQIRNFASNTAFAALDEIQRVPAVVTDAVLGLFSGRRTVQGPSLQAMAKAGREAATRGVREAGQIIREGATDDQFAGLENVREVNTGNRVFDASVNAVFRGMSAADRIFKVYALERSLQEQMKLAKATEPTNAMRIRAIEDANFATFNNDNALASGFARMKSTMRTEGGAAGKAAAFAADMVVPFARTPANVLARVSDYTPAGGIIKATAASYRALKESGMSPENQRALSQAMGRGMVGSGIILMGYLLADKDKMKVAGLDAEMTGISPKDPGERAVHEAAGRLAGSVRLGDTWHKVDSLSPLGNLLVLGATMRREQDRGLPAALELAAQTVGEQPMMKGLQDVFTAMKEPAGRAKSYAGSVAGSFVPTIVSDVAGLADDKRRDARGKNMAGSMAAGVASRVPGLRNTLPARRDVFGQVQEQKVRTAIDPTIGTTAKESKDRVLREMVENRVHMGQQRPGASQTSAEFGQEQEIIGEAIRKRLERVIDSPAYQAGDKQVKSDLMTKSISATRSRASMTTRGKQYTEMRLLTERSAFLRRRLQLE